MECQNSNNLQLGLFILGCTYELFLFRFYIKYFQIMGTRYSLSFVTFIFCPLHQDTGLSMCPSVRVTCPSVRVSWIGLSSVRLALGLPQGKLGVTLAYMADTSHSKWTPPKHEHAPRLTRRRARRWSRSRTVARIRRRALRHSHAYVVVHSGSRAHTQSRAQAVWHTRSRALMQSRAHVVARCECRAET